MKKKTNIWIYPLILMGLIVMNMCNIPDTLAQTSGGTVTDIDGNVYTTVKIGIQVWMVENLKTTKFNDGTPIHLVKNYKKWINLDTPGYCWYENDDANKNLYGALYNWFSVNTGKLAPKGWHVPTDAEWTTLMTYLGGDNVAGGKMKDGEREWVFRNQYKSTNESGFTALPGGIRTPVDAEIYEGFTMMHSCAIYWSSTQFDATDSWYRVMYNNWTKVARAKNSKTLGYSVRCIKD